ncbi:hypothetical protein EJ04DRAFT_513384 [Polyplosphaeria fusca]|uniref:Uncharacterized protein n=1 Tax=Polyplosphaeria fusca TaxID=682080 RepID=A0A9P4QYE6_9PLEO|nr:hypothetical protein EJ04DRAFT_513384 [Polyplosphaeria fusca]
MRSSRLTYLSAFAALLSLGASDPESVCRSFGIDFVDEGHYFINSQSTEQFTCVSTFQGCNEDVADILLVDPNNDEYLCSQIPTRPDNTPELSTCPIQKNQMMSGDWIILVLGNNDDGYPFAWERDISLDVGEQKTSTVTQTASFNITTTSTIVATVTRTDTITSTNQPTATFTVPSKTAKFTKTIVPKAVTTTSTKKFTRTRFSWTKQLKIVTKTATATCTIPTKEKDKPATYSPTLIHPAALVTPTGAAPKMHRYVRKSDRPVDIEYARRRIEAARAKRDVGAAPLDQRAPDEPIITVTAPEVVNVTTTYTGIPTTTTETALAITTTTTQLPPVTIVSGVLTKTTTLPTPTKTRLAFAWTTTTKVITIGATFTRTTTILPTASVSACKHRGGHYGWGRL